MRRGHRLELAVVVGRLVQQVGRAATSVGHTRPGSRWVVSCNSQLFPSGSANVAKLRTARRSRPGTRLLDVVQPGAVPDLADLRAAADQLVPGGLDVLDDQVQVPTEPGVIVDDPRAELDRAGEPGGVNCTIR